jgi:hypothetical protein
MRSKTNRLVLVLLVLGDELLLGELLGLALEPVVLLLAVVLILLGCCS